MEERKAQKTRNTKETEITVTLNIDGEGKSAIKTSIGLLDHMLELFAFWGHFDLTVTAKGDLYIDIHHTNEDIGIVLGDTFKEALGDKIGIRRNGSAAIPMEDVLATVAVDISGRGFFRAIAPANKFLGLKEEEKYSFEYANHFLESFAKRLGMNLDVRLTGTSDDLHTNLEPVFKALGIALDQATQIDPRRKGVPSTKGIID